MVHQELGEVEKAEADMQKGLELGHKQPGPWPASTLEFNASNLNLVIAHGASLLINKANSTVNM